MIINLNAIAGIFRASRVSNIGFCSKGEDNDQAILFNFFGVVLTSFYWVGWNIKDAQFLNGEERLGILLEKYEDDGNGNLIMTLRMIIMDLTGATLQDKEVLVRTIPYSADIKLTIHLFSVDAKEDNFLFLFRTFTNGLELIEWDYINDISTVTNLSFDITEPVTESQNFALVGGDDLFFVVRKNSKKIYRLDISTKAIEDWLTLPQEGGFLTNDGGYTQENNIIVFSNGENLISTSGNNVVIINPVTKIITKTIYIGDQSQLVGLEYYIGEKNYIVALKVESLDLYDPDKTSNYLVETRTFPFLLEQFAFDRVAGLAIVIGDDTGDTRLGIYKIFNDAISYVGGYYITDEIKNVLVDFPSEQVIYTTKNSDLIIFRDLMNGYILQISASEKTFEYENTAKNIIVNGLLTDTGGVPIEGVTINWDIIKDATVSASLTISSSITNNDGWATTGVNMEGVGKCRVNGVVVA